MIRLSVTEVDGFLYWKQSDEGLDALLARLTGQVEPTVQMQAGKAFHKIFENATEGEITETTVDGFTFDFAFSGDVSISPPVIRELKGELLLSTPVGPVVLVGKVDALNGRTVHDYKLTERFDAERYADSFQWRAYLLMFGATTFVYDVFQARYDERRITVYDYHHLKFHSYPDIRGDVVREVSELAEIITKHLPQRVTEAA